MPIIAMRTVSADKHPNADQLTVYTFESPNFGSVQVIANAEHSYKPGDVAQVALVGTQLLDGTVIKRVRLRGVDSMGMAMGVVSVAVDTDLSEGNSLVVEAPDTGSLIKWTSIELLHEVLRELRARAEIAERQMPTVAYRAKVKLHGTNAGVQVHPDGRVVPQGRNGILTLEDDNYGFARWVGELREVFAAVRSDDGVRTLYGEWCGPGIQKRVSITKIERKVFAVFAVQHGDHTRGAATLTVEPDGIAALVPEHADVYVLPWNGVVTEVPFADAAGLQASVDAINEQVIAVEQNDPWVEATFGVKGTGEGLVLYPMLGSDPHDRDELTALMFKAKGEEHRVRKQSKPAQIDPEVAKTIEGFVETFVTEARLQQGLSEACPDGANPRQTGAFLKWIGQDVSKEGAAELAQAGLTWKQVSKAVTTKARTWFIAQTRRMS